MTARSSMKLMVRMIPRQFGQVMGILKIDGLVKSLLGRHPGESRGPDIVPAEAGNH